MPTRRALDKLVARWIKRFDLGRWDIEVIVPEVGYKDVANCEASPEYRKAVLYFNLAGIADDDLEMYVRHELGHCLTAELAALAEQLTRGDPVLKEQVRLAEELLVTRIETLPVWGEIG